MSNDYQDELKKILESAQRLGVEMDEGDALQWLAAVSAQGRSNIDMDVRTGIFGHAVTMLDFDDADLAHFRQVGRLVEFNDIPGKVETALALSGSAAQSKIQTYPGDADYFERVNIIAPSKEEACTILADIMRDKALSTLKGDTYQLIEVKFGSFPFDIRRGDKLEKQGSPICWYPPEIKAGKIEGQTPNGAKAAITWEAASHDPGWCKLDWVVADPVRKQLVNASNMLDVTWEAPDGQVTPLDGYLDGYFQEVYLDAESIPVFSKLVKHVSGDALDDYVAQLEKEVKKYTSKDPNYGKAAKRLYNIFRLTGRYTDAAYLRELFDEPATILYQIGALIRTVDESFQPGSEIDQSTILSQADELIVGVTSALEGAKEVEIVRMLLNFRGLLVDDINRGELSPQANAARAEIINIVNNFFREKLMGVPTIEAYLEGLK
ncbi:MAG: hypothetical protein JW908_17050 [Anaerolineales bacterium]|nr:hypothetical protein [Anaerolineales bacterium]